MSRSWAYGVACGMGFGLLAGPWVASPARRVAQAVRSSVSSLTESPRVVAPTSRARERPATPEGLSLWVVDDSTKVFPGDVLGTASAPGPAAPARLEGAAGETVAFQLILASSAGSPKVEADVSVLEGPAGKLPRESIGVFLESYLDCPPVVAKVVSFGPGEYPDALVPLWERGPGSRPIASPFALAPKRNQGLWIDVEIPRGTRAGEYKGALRFKAAGHPEAEVPLHLTVYGFEIPASRHLAAWVPLYETRLWKRESLHGQDEHAVRDVLWAYFRMAHAHGFMTQIQEDEPATDFDKTTGALRSVQWSRYDALNGPVLDGTLYSDGVAPSVWKVGGGHWWGARPGDPPNFGGYFKTDTDLTPAHRRALKEYAQAIEHHFQERRWEKPRLFMYWVDEPDFQGHANYATLIKAFCETVKAAGKIELLLTAGPDEKPELHDAVGIWATWGGGYVPSQMRRRQEAGQLAWFYQQHEPFVGGQSVNDEGLAMRTWPWIAWRYGVDGIFLWAGNFWNENPYRDPVNWGKNLLGNGVFFYPGALLPSLGFPSLQGPVSSFRMKAMRRGLQDYEYLHLLKTLGGDPDTVVRRIVRAALNESGSIPPWTHPRWGQPGDWSHDAKEWDAARRGLAVEILKRTTPAP